MTDQLVAGMMAERVVDVLEAVDVDAGDGEPVAFACRRVGEFGELRLQLAPVGQAGETVMIGKMLRLGFPGLDRAGGGEEPPGEGADHQQRDGEADQDERQHVLHQQQARAPRRPGQGAERLAGVGAQLIGAAPLALRLAEAEVGQQHVAPRRLPIGRVELDERDQDARRRALQAHIHRRRDRHSGSELAMAADLHDRGGAAAVAAGGVPLGRAIQVIGVGDAGRDVAGAADLLDQRHRRGEIGGEAVQRDAALAIIGVDRPVLLIEDHDPVVVEALGHEGADLEVEPAGIDRAAALGHRFVPPGDGAHFGERPGEAAVQAVVDQLGLRADDILVHLARGIEDDGDHRRADQQHDDGDGHDKTARRRHAVFFPDAGPSPRHCPDFLGD